MKSKARISSREAEPGRLFLARLKKDTDLISGIKEVCRCHDITCGTIISVLGSLRSARFAWAVRDKTSPKGIRFGAPVEIDGPLEFICGNGWIGTQNGELDVHLHGVMSDQCQKIYGAHFNQGHNPVWATIEITIQEHINVKLCRAHEEEADAMVFQLFPAV